MTRRPTLLTLLALLVCTCRRPPSGAAAASRSPPDVARASAPPDPPAPRWCFEPMPRADVRAIDHDGRVWSVRGDSIARDGDGAGGSLPPEVPCPSPGLYAMDFGPDGAAAVAVDGRLYLRASAGAAFVVTPICTDLGGAPWSPRAQGGWSVIANAWRSVGPGLLITRESNLSTGWYAITAIDRSITAGVLDANQSLLSLVNEGHVILVDQLQTVAGEVLAARGEAFSTLSRSAAGVVAAHDVAGGRVLVTSRSLREAFARIESRRDGTTPTRAVVAVDLARFVAVTDDAVELSVDRGRTFRTVLHRAPSDGGAPGLERPHVGRLRDGRLAVATRDGLAVDRCP